jgi:hypothetical protein
MNALNPFDNSIFLSNLTNHYGRKNHYDAEVKYKLIIVYIFQTIHQLKYKHSSKVFIRYEVNTLHRELDDQHEEQMT